MAGPKLTKPTQRKKRPKSVQNETMEPKIQRNGPKRLSREGVQLRGQGRLPGTVQPIRINRVRSG